MKVKKAKYVAAQGVMPFASGVAGTWVPTCMGGDGPGEGLRVDRVFDMEEWRKEVMGRPASGREVDAK